MSSSLKIALVLGLGLSAVARADAEIEVAGRRSAASTTARRQGRRWPTGAADDPARVIRDRRRRAYVGGSVTILARVGLDGKVLAAHVIDGNLGAWPIEKCLVGLARKMDLRQADTAARPRCASRSISPPPIPPYPSRDMTT